MPKDKENTWTDKKWTEKVALMNEWIADHPQKKFEDTIEILELNIKRGTKSKTKRDKAWKSCLQEMREFEDSTIGGKGAASNLPQEVQDSLKTIHTGLIEEQTPAHGKYTSLVTFRRKTEGEGDDKTTIRTFFLNGTDRATAWANGRVAMLKNAYKDGDWDGTEAGLIKMADAHALIEAATDEE